MKVVFTEGGYEDFCYWEQNNKKIFTRIKTLIKSIKESPFRGIGKPEPLRENLSCYWSRRITYEHRLVYTVSGKKGEQILTILQCRYHY